jgi:uncharacterized protein (TIGR02145 family)
MAENLNYNASGSECYGSNPASCEKYGRLYAWAAALEACPSGWHLPSDSEWGALVAAAGGPNMAGKKLKAKKGWSEGGNGTDRLGFSALPGGYSDRFGYSKRFFGFGYSSGSFYDVGNYGYWWSATEYDASYAYYRYMDFGGATVHRGDFNKSLLFSVRCVQD